MSAQDRLWASIKLDDGFPLFATHRILTVPTSDFGQMNGIMETNSAACKKAVNNRRTMVT
jgi:hypothetical protein